VTELTALRKAWGRFAASPNLAHSALEKSPGDFPTTSLENASAFTTTPHLRRRRLVINLYFSRNSGPHSPTKGAGSLDETSAGGLRFPGSGKRKEERRQDKLSPPGKRGAQGCRNRCSDRSERVFRSVGIRIQGHSFRCLRSRRRGDAKQGACFPSFMQRPHPRILWALYSVSL